MKIRTVLIGLLLLTAYPLTRTEAADLNQAGIVSSDKHELQEGSKANACDCCQKCMAAKSSIVSKEDEGPADKNGCQDCCQRCGKVLKSFPEGNPPETIKKQVPPKNKNRP